MNSNRKNASDRICREGQQQDTTFFSMYRKMIILLTLRILLLRVCLDIWTHLELLESGGKLSCHYLKILNYKLGEINTIFFVQKMGVASKRSLTKNSGDTTQAYP